MLPVKYLGNSKIKSEMLIEEFCHLCNTFVKDDVWYYYHSTPY